MSFNFMAEVTFRKDFESQREAAQSCPPLYDPMDCNPPGFSILEISQARVLEWVVISFSRGSSPPRDRTWVSLIAGKLFTVWATREAKASTRSRGRLGGRAVAVKTHEVKKGARRPSPGARSTLPARCEDGRQPALSPRGVQRAAAAENQGEIPK